jgi:predicted TIM-barrel fold metal-dependent hydrolase
MTATETPPTAPGLDFRIYDADEHYYEAEDALTRHLDRKYRNAVRWIDMDGRRTLLIGGKLLQLIPNPTYDPVGRPGALNSYFRAQNHAGRSLKEILGEPQPLQPEYHDRDARVRMLDEQGVEFAWVLPSLGLGIEEMLKDDLEGLCAVARSYNDWLDDDWGYDRDGRIQTAPLLPLGDEQFAEAELRRLVERGARLVVMRPAPVQALGGPRSLGDPAHDRVWALAAEAGVVVAFHAADDGYTDAGDWGENARYTGLKQSAFVEVLSVHSERPIFDTMAAMVCHGVYDRHPELKVATVELGAGWVFNLLRRFRIAYGKQPQSFTRDPIETFREHVWIAPFYEDDFEELADQIGLEHVLLGSDWPHPEGIAQPSDYLADVAGFSPDAQRRIMRENLRELVGR